MLTLNIGNNRPIDPIDPVIDDAIRTKTVPYDIVKNADTSVGNILIEFADIMDADIWYDDDGRLYFSKSVVEDSVNRYEQFSSQWDFVEKDGYFADATLESEQSDMINTVVVTNASSEAGMDTYFAENDHPQSPLRVSLIGTKASEIVSTEMGYNEQRRKEYANRLLQSQCLNAYAISFSTISIPHLDVNRTVTVTHKEYEFDKETFILQDIDIDIEKGTMDISATQIIWLPGYSDSGAANFDTHEITPDTYTISFDIGYSAEGTAPATKYKNQGDVFSLPNSKNFSRSNYNFDGWKSNVDGGVYSAGYSFTVGTQNITFVAQWASIKRPDNYWVLKYEVTSDSNTIVLDPFTEDICEGIINWGDDTDDEDYISNETCSHVYDVAEGETKTVVIKIYVDIENSQYTVPLFLCDTGSSVATHTASQLLYIKTPNNMTIIPSAFLNNMMYSSYPNIFSKLQTLLFSSQLTQIMDGAIRGCNGLTSVDLPSSLTYIGSEVFSNSSITELVIPENVEVCRVYNMPMLEKATILNAGNQLKAPTLAGSPKLKEVIIGEKIEVISDGWLGAVNSSEQMSITISEGLKGLINGSLSHPSLVSLELPDSIQYIGIGALVMSGITELAIPYTCYVDVTAIPTNCTLKLKEVPSTKYSIASSTITTVAGITGLTYNGQEQNLGVTLSNSDGSTGKYIRTGTPWGNNGRAFLQSIGQSPSAYQCYDLIEGFDYDITDKYGNANATAIKAGEHTIRLTGKGRMNSYVSATVTISPSALSKSIIDNGITKIVANDNISISNIDYVDGGYYVNGNTNYYKPSGYKPEVLVSATFDDYTDNLRCLTTNTDTQTANKNSYYISSTINSETTSNPVFINVGRYRCRIIATSGGSYSGSIEYYTDGTNGYKYYYYQVLQKSITDNDIILTYRDLYDYTGSAITPEILLTYTYDGGMVYELIKDIDYTLSVSETTIGDGNITITGIGNFTGEINKTYKINAPTTDVSTESEEQLAEVYTGYLTPPTEEEESVPALSYNATYNSYDLFPQENGIINIGSDKSAILNLKPPIINLPNLSKTGSGAFNLVVDENGEMLKRSSAKKYKTNISYDIDTDYWHNVFMQLKTGSYNYKNTPNVFELGMFADDVAEICPQIARYSEDGVENYDDRAIIQMLVMEVQRLNKEIQTLKDSLK